MIPSGDHYGYFGDKIQATNGFSDSVSNYKTYLKEETVEYSHSKRSSFDGEPIMVGSMARLFLFSDKLKKTASQLFTQSALGKGDSNSIWNNLAQAIEIVEAIDRAQDILNSLIDSYNDWHKSKPLIGSIKKGIGGKNAVGTVECPRGTLYHEYTVSSEGIILSANMITPSAQNTYRIERDIQEIVASLLEDEGGINDEESVSSNLETLIRAYDPCNTCATHMVSVKLLES